MGKTKKKFEWWKRESINAEVIENSDKAIEIILYGFIPSKKNNRRNFWHISLPSETYTEWHKRIVSVLSWIEWKFKSFPCKITIASVAWDRVKSDIDNQAQSIFDTFTDLWIIPDDNRFIVQELHITNMGYVKNAYMTKVLIEWDYTLRYNDDWDHKGFDLKQYTYHLS
jgi:Holliday junction resolvase RusA-like endonuclease